MCVTLGNAERRDRACRRVHFRWTQSPESRTRRALQDPHGQRRAGDRLSESARERASVSRQRDVAGGCQRERLSASRLQEFDGVVRLHRRPASLGISGGGTGETFARQERRGGGGAGSWVGEVGEMKGMIFAAGLGTSLRA